MAFLKIYQHLTIRGTLTHPFADVLLHSRPVKVAYNCIMGLLYATVTLHASLDRLHWPPLVTSPLLPGVLGLLPSAYAMQTYVN